MIHANNIREILDAAERVANIAGIITGEGLIKSHSSAQVMQLPELLVQLKQATRDYNNLVLAQLLNRRQVVHNAHNAHNANQT